MRFNGSDYEHERDSPRLSAQLGRIWECMKDRQPRTLREISEITGDPQASISAQLRHLRKPRFGGHTVLKTHLGNGLYVYTVIPNVSKQG